MFTMPVWVEEQREAGVGGGGQERSNEGGGRRGARGPILLSLLSPPARPSLLWTLCLKGDRTIFLRS